ncbi:hypothetical protein ANO11243_044120 [Dothideomycetidae sp. 11243]|nr:hypothetical protein ANO11243_044120 [fungal sp. No.11243]
MQFSLALVLLHLLFFVVATPIAHGETSDVTPLRANPRRSVDDAGRRNKGTVCQCDLSKAQMPQAPTPLPSPSTGLTLTHIAIGRGTQNYTCATNDSTTVPAAFGALASLFNVTCVDVDSPGLVAQLPGIALNLPIPFTPAVDHAAENFFDYSGAHFFLDNTTPYFNLNTATHQYGSGAFKKLAASNAPAGSIVGPHNKGNGAVPWLKLTADTAYADYTSQTLKEVYRLNTAGGSPPPTCAGQQPKIFVPYSAEYWFYS